MGSVQAGKALHLVRKSAVLVACLQQLPPDGVEAPVMLLQHNLVLLLHLQAAVVFS